MDVTQNKEIKRKKGGRRRRIFLKGWIFGMAAGVLMCLGVFVFCYLCRDVLFTKNGSSGSGDETSLKDQEDSLNEQLTQRLSEINTLIDEHFIFQTDSQEMLDDALKGYVEGLDDPYSVYYTAEEYADMMAENEGSFVGIGVAVRQDETTLAVTVTTVYTESPAAEAGMQEGDVLYRVDGEDITGLALSEIVSKIKGEEGAEVTVTVLRGEEEMEFTMERRKQDIVTVNSRMLEEDIGYLQLTEFDDVSASQLESAIKELQAEGMERLVLDLRDNPGGLLSSVLDIADDFLPEAEIMYSEDKQGNRTDYTAEAGELFEGEMAVLVNGNSASAAEVLSGALKDNSRAVLVGERTFGKGIVQTFYSFSDGSGIKLTTAHYFTPSGTDIHGVGITPDVAAEDDSDTEEDEVLAAAVEELKN